MKALIVVVVLIIISLFYSYRYGKYNAELSLLRGFWESNKDFNDESGLKSFTMYIGEKDCGEYPTYLLMVDNEEKILVNAPTNMSLAGSWFGSSEPDCHEFVATFTDLNSEFIPNKICFKLYPRSGKIILSGSDTIYGCLFKNPVLSELDLIKNTLKGQNIKPKMSSDTP
jgi:hypothetical protein